MQKKSVENMKEAIKEKRNAQLQNKREEFLNKIKNNDLKMVEEEKKMVIEEEKKKVLVPNKKKSDTSTGLATITLTYDDQAENHRPIQKIGQLASEGFSVQDLEEAKVKFEEKEGNCEIINLNDGLKGTKARSSRKESSQEQVDTMITKFSIAITGARDNDILLGVEPRSKGVLIRIHATKLNPQGIIRPQAKGLSPIRDYPNLWKKFINKLAILPFFRDMSFKQREDWLNKNETDDDTYIGEKGDNVQIELLQPGTGPFSDEKVDPQDLERILEGNPNDPNGWWSEDDIKDIIPGKPGSKGLKGRHTLMFEKSGWKIAADIKMAERFDDLVFNVYDGTLSRGAVVDKNTKLLIIGDVTSEVIPEKNKKAGKTSLGDEIENAKWERTGNQSIGMLVDSEEMAFTAAAMNGLLYEILGELGYAVDDDLKVTLEKIRANFKNFTAGAYKSLLQKLIRFRAKKTTLLDATLVDTRLVLLLTMMALGLNPGSFVPDIQRYVTGLESLAKRLGVCLFEESSVADTTKKVSLFSGALLAQRARTWKPSRRLLKRWLMCGLEGYDRPYAYYYNIPEGLALKPYNLSTDNTPLQTCSFLLEQLRSFAGDYGLTRFVATYYDKATYNWDKIKEIEEIENMVIYHFIDQHAQSGLPYFMSPTLLQDIHDDSDEPSSRPFMTFFSRLFREVTGYNSRKNISLYRLPEHKDSGIKEKKSIKFSEDDLFVKEVRKGQRAYMIAWQEKQIQRPVNNDKPFVLDTTLDISWLAGLVGALEVKGSPPVLVTMKADNPLELVAIRRPARGIKDVELTDEREEQALAAAKEMLKNGVPLNKAQAPGEFLENATLYMRTDKDENDYYVIKKHGKEKTWDEARHVSLELPIHDKQAESIEHRLLYIGEGIQARAFDDLDELCVETDDTVIRRVLYYISTFLSEFEMNRISRDGGATKQPVIVKDVAAYQFFLKLCQLFPAALRPVQYGPLEFISPVGPLLWHVRDWLKNKLRENQDTDKWEDVDIYDRENRKMKEYQESSVQEMIDSHKLGIRGIFSYLSVGMGKSLITLEYIKYLHEHGQLPNYIFWVLPAEATESIGNEILYYGLPVKMMIPLKTHKKVKVPDGVEVVYTAEPKPGYITMIEHDHLRLCQDELSMIADQSLFVFDEVHEMLRDSLRTGAALQLSRLSSQFVCLTGTPVIDDKIYRLVPWLEQIVAFSVNEKNFWVAVTTMVSRAASTGVKTEHNQYWKPFNARELSEYKILVPPGLGGVGTMSRMENIREAANLSYLVADRGLIEQILKVLSEKVRINVGPDPKNPVWEERNRGVIVVTATNEHQEKIKDELVRAGLKKDDIFMITKSTKLHLTEKTVGERKTPAYKVAITTKQKGAGFTLSYLNSFVSGIYPSNQAKRMQLEGRINRAGQKAELVKYVYVGAGIVEEDGEGNEVVQGILPLMREKHINAGSIEAAIKSIAQTYEVSTP